MSIEVKTINLSTVINVQTLWEPPTRREKKIRTRSLAEAKLEQFCLGCICHPNLKFIRGGKITHTLAHTFFHIPSPVHDFSLKHFLFLFLPLLLPELVLPQGLGHLNLTVLQKRSSFIPLLPIFRVFVTSNATFKNSFLRSLSPPPLSSRIPVLHKGR